MPNVPCSSSSRVPVVKHRKPVINSLAHALRVLGRDFLETVNTGGTKKLTKRVIQAARKESGRLAALAALKTAG